MWIGATLFFLVVFGVWILVYTKKGKPLTYGAEQYQSEDLIYFKTHDTNITTKSGEEIIKNLTKK